MTPSRRLASAVLALGLAAGCNQSLFDANPGGDDDSDGRPPDRLDAGTDGRGGDEPDAGNPRKDCPVADCVGDAVGEFATNQAGPWRYVEVQANELGFVALEYDAARVPPAWTSMALNPPSIVNCDAHTQAPGCAGLDQRILLQPSADATAPRPALAWTAPATGTYRLSIDWRLDDTQTSPTPTAVLVARNSQSDRILAAAFDAGIEVGTFPQAGGVEVDAVQGDSIALALAGNQPPALGVTFYVSDLERNDFCRMAFPLEGAPPFQNACAAAGDAFIETGSQTTTAMEPPDGIPGVARTFSVNSRLEYQGDINDYSGDWTLQFWGRFDTPGDVLSDISCRDQGAGIVSGGISVKYAGDSVVIRAAEEFEGADYCTAPPREIQIMPSATFAATDWHFYRIVRDRNGGRVDVCVDGEYFDSVGISANSTMATDRVLTLGNTTGTPATPSFIGQLADLRVYDRALPCIPGS